MNDRIKQVSIVSLFALLWLLMFSATAAQAPSQFYQKSSVHKSASPQKAPSPAFEVTETQEEEQENSLSAHPDHQIYQLFSLLNLDNSLQDQFHICGSNETSSSVGLFILYCALRIPLPSFFV